MVQSLGKGSGPVRTAQVAQGALNQTLQAYVHGGIECTTASATSSGANLSKINSHQILKV